MTAALRVGIIVPSVNTVVEAWYPQVVPAGTSVHFARMLTADALTRDTVVAMDRGEGMRAIHQIASCRPHAVAYGCTVSSILQGHAYDAALRGEIARIAGAPATTATDSIFAACRALGLRRVTAVSPYPEAIGETEARFFAEGGIATIAAAHLGITDGFALAGPTPERILDLALGAWDADADGMLITCLNFRSHAAIEAIEARIGKPVVTSTQAVLWHLLRLAGDARPIAGCGTLLRDRSCLATAKPHTQQEPS